MVRVRFERRGETVSLTVCGHAGYAPRGQDIVCAAASMLSMTAAARASALGQVRTLDMQEGSMRLVCEAAPQVLEALETVRAGFAVLAEKYPAHISLTGAADRPANTNGVARQRAVGEQNEEVF